MGGVTGGRGGVVAPACGVETVPVAGVCWSMFIFVICSYTKSTHPTVRILRIQRTKCMRQGAIIFLCEQYTNTMCRGDVVIR